MKLKLMIFAALSTLCGACTKKQDAPIIGKQHINITDGKLTPEILWAMGRMGDVQVSPDGEKLLYSVSYYSVKENKSNSEIYTMNADGSNVTNISNTGFSEYSARWINGGKEIAFLSAESGSIQLWKMNTNGKKRVQVSNREGGIDGFTFSPDETKIILIAQVKSGTRTTDLHPDLDKTTGKVITELMYKHWDEWVESVPHPFLCDYNGKNISNEIDLLEGEPYASPLKPFGGTEQLAFSPDGKTIAYTSKKKTGKAYAISTNSDIYLYNIETKTTVNLTEGMMGYDLNPTFSPDGKYIAWESMERDGYESDKNRLFIHNLATGEKTYLTADFDQSVASLQWSNDASKIYFTSCWHATTQVYAQEVASKAIRQITEGTHDYGWVGITANGLIGMRNSMSTPAELFAINETSGEQQQISFENKHLLDQLEMGRVEERWITTTDNKKMLTWVIYPPHFDPNKKYPALLYCQGGPQSPVSQFWSFRWNFQIMAANDYIIVAPNRRGLPGFGQEWLEQISGDYGGQNMKDYLAAIDAVKAEPFVDENRLGCVGASYGGFSAYWLAGNHDKRFKAFIAHDGIFNMEQQYLETEEMWFANWDMGGAYWDKNNATAQRTFANSPHKFVDKWDTPILVIHGEKDYRILASQGMAAFNAARLRDIPAELLIYPDENHWVLRPQNGILWQRTFFGWLDKWLK